MNFNIPNANDTGDSELTDPKKPNAVEPDLTDVDFGETVTNTKGAVPTPAPRSQTIIGGHNSKGKPAGRPPRRANEFGSRKTVSWITFQAQAETLEALQEASGIKTRTELLELAVASLVNEFNKKGSLSRIDKTLAHSPNHIKPKTNNQPN